MCIPEGTLRAYLDGQLDGVEREPVASHLGDCERCRAAASVTAERRDRVQRLIEGTVPTDALRPPAVVLAELRSRVAAGPSRLLPLGLVPRLSLALVAITVAALGIWTTVHDGDTAPASARSSDSAQLTSPGVSAAEVTAPPRQAGAGPSASTATPRPAEHRVRTERLARTAGPRSVARPKSVERYVVFADEVAAPDLGMVVRVKVPVSFPATSSAASDDGHLYQEIEADVLVRQDGRPYAIRLIQDSRTPGRK